MRGRISPRLAALLATGVTWRELTARIRPADPSRDPRSNGSTWGHAPGVLPAGMTFDCAEMAAAYLAGARSARTHHPASDHLIERACDAYVKLAHVRRLDG